MMMTSQQSYGHEKRRALLGSLGIGSFLTGVLLGAVMLQFFYFHTRISILESELRQQSAATEQMTALDVTARKNAEAASSRSSKLVDEVRQECQKATEAEAARREAGVKQLERLVLALSWASERNTSMVPRLQSLVSQTVADIKALDKLVAHVQAGGEEALLAAQQSSLLAQTALDTVRNHTGKVDTQLLELHSRLRRQPAQPAVKETPDAAFAAGPTLSAKSQPGRTAMQATDAPGGGDSGGGSSGSDSSGAGGGGGGGESGSKPKEDDGLSSRPAVDKADGGSSSAAADGSASAGGDSGSALLKPAAPAGGTALLNGGGPVGSGSSAWNESAATRGPVEGGTPARRRASSAVLGGSAGPRTGGRAAAAGRGINDAAIRSHNSTRGNSSRPLGTSADAGGGSFAGPSTNKLLSQQLLAAARKASAADGSAGTATAASDSSLSSSTTSAGTNKASSAGPTSRRRGSPPYGGSGGGMGRSRTPFPRADDVDAEEEQATAERDAAVAAGTGTSASGLTGGKASESMRSGTSKKPSSAGLEGPHGVSLGAALKSLSHHSLDALHDLVVSKTSKPAADKGAAGGGGGGDGKGSGAPATVPAGAGGASLDAAMMRVRRGGSSSGSSGGGAGVTNPKKIRL